MPRSQVANKELKPSSRRMGKRRGQHNTELNSKFKEVGMKLTNKRIKPKEKESTSLLKKQTAATYYKAACPSYLSDLSGLLYYL